MRYNLYLIGSVISICSFTSFHQLFPVFSSLKSDQPAVNPVEGSRVDPALEDGGEQTLLSAQTLSSPDAPAEDGTITGDRAFEAGRPLAARVNNRPVYLDTFEKQVARYEQVLIAQNVDLDSAAGQLLLAQVRRQVLDSLVDQIIIEQQAEAMGIQLTEAEIEASIQETIAQAGDQGRFETWLGKNDLGYDSFSAEVRAELIAGRVFDQVIGDIPDAAEQIRLRYIRLADQVTALALIEQLKIGADFVSLAQTHSLDKEGPASGGDLGWFPRRAGLVPDQVETVAFSLNPGEMIGPIQTGQDFYIIKLEEKEVERPLTTEMRQTLKKQIFKDWLGEKRTAAAIETYIMLK